MRSFITFLGMLLVSSAAHASAAEPSSLATIFRDSRMAGVGRILSGTQIGVGARAVFVYDVHYGARFAKQVRLCTGEALRVGEPVLFAINGAGRPADCPAGTRYVPVDDRRTFLMPGFVDAYSGRLVFRARYPHDQILGCNINLITVSTTFTRQGKAIDQVLGPFDASGRYFFWKDFLKCIRSETSGQAAGKS